MKYLLGFIVVALCGAFGSPNHGPSRVVAQENNVDTVEYCSLLKNSTLFDGKLVRIQAVYRYGYEWAEMYCPGCLTEGRTWVDFDESFERCTKPEVSKKLGENGFKGRTVNVVAVGRFSSLKVYEQMGKIIYSSNPTRGSGATTNGWTRTTSDNAGRLIEIAMFSGDAQPSATSYTNSTGLRDHRVQRRIHHGNGSGWKGSAQQGGRPWSAGES